MRWAGGGQEAGRRRAGGGHDEGWGHVTPVGEHAERRARRREVDQQRREAVGDGAVVAVVAHVPATWQGGEGM